MVKYERGISSSSEIISVKILQIPAGVEGTHFIFLYLFWPNDQSDWEHRNSNSCRKLFHFFAILLCDFDGPLESFRIRLWV